MKLIKGKKIILIIILSILLLFLFIGINTMIVYINKDIPFIPISYSDVSKIEINNYSSKNATDSEKREILSILDSLKKCNNKIRIPKYSNGKPEYINIQIFLRSITNGKNFCYIIPYGNDTILISRPQSQLGYIVKTDKFDKYFNHK
jgi:hypothetical protein